MRSLPGPTAILYVCLRAEGKQTADKRFTEQSFVRPKYLIRFRFPEQSFVRVHIYIARIEKGLCSIAPHRPLFVSTIPNQATVFSFS